MHSSNEFSVDQFKLHASIQKFFFLFTYAFNKNYNYGKAGKDLKVDLLNHLEYIEQNATLASQVAIWR